jgi:hypothetical protein
MDIRTLKNGRGYFWTNHTKYKLLEYGLSPTAIKSVVRRPERTEVGIAPNTTAVMRRKDGKKIKREVWVMYQNRETRNVKHEPVIKIISVWIYPGVSPQGKEIFIPEDVWEEINQG